MNIPCFLNTRNPSNCFPPRFSVVVIKDIKLKDKFWRKSVSAVTSLQADPNLLLSLRAKNMLMPNHVKCKNLSSRRGYAYIHYYYVIGNVILKKVMTIKDIGIMFNESLSHRNYVLEIAASAVKALGLVILSCRNFRSKSALKTLLNIFVNSRLEYTSIVWKRMYINYGNEFESVQKRYFQ